MKPLTVHSRICRPTMSPSHLCRIRNMRIAGPSAGRRRAAAPETEIQQPETADGKHEPEARCHAQQRIVYIRARVVIHDVQHPEDVEPAPEAVPAGDELTGLRMDVERGVQP